MEEYRGKADKVDRLLGEEEEGRGRMRRRLDQFGELIGLVSGLFNEASNDTLMLLDAMATSRVTKLARESGLTSDQQEVEKGRAGGKCSEPTPKFHIHQFCELQNLRTTKISNLPKLYKNQEKLIFVVQTFLKE